MYRDAGIEDMASVIGGSSSGRSERASPEREMSAPAARTHPAVAGISKSEGAAQESCGQG